MEARSKRNQELSKSIRELLVQQENPENLVRQLQDKIKSTEDERLQMEVCLDKTVDCCFFEISI